MPRILVPGHTNSNPAPIHTNPTVEKSNRRSGDQPRPTTLGKTKPGALSPQSSDEFSCLESWFLATLTRIPLQSTPTRQSKKAIDGRGIGITPPTLFFSAGLTHPVPDLCKLRIAPSHPGSLLLKEYAPGSDRHFHV